MQHGTGFAVAMADDQYLGCILYCVDDLSVIGGNAWAIAAAFLLRAIAKVVAVVVRWSKDFGGDCSSSCSGGPDSGLMFGDG